MPRKMFVNDIDMSQFGLWINTPTGVEDAPRIEDNVITMQGRPGGMIVPGEARIGPREITVEGELIAHTADDARDMWDAAKAVLSQPELEIGFLRTSQLGLPTRIAYGRYQTVAWLPIGPMDKGAGFRMTFLLASPYWVDRQVDIWGIPNGFTIPLDVLGTAPSFTRLRIIGTGVIPGGTPIVRYRDVQGIIRGDVQFQIALASYNWIDYNFDGYQQALYYVDQNAPVSIVPQTETPLSHLFNSVDPNDGDGVVGPSLQGINCNVVAHIRKAWL